MSKVHVSEPSCSSTAPSTPGESLEVILIGAAFDQEVSLMCMDDGVYQLVKGSDTSQSDMKNFMPTFRTLGDAYGRTSHVCRQSFTGGSRSDAG